MGLQPKDFHAHLDVCKQCAEQPFNLCPIGHKLLLKVLTVEKKEVNKIIFNKDF